jgi:MFS family permease
MTTSFDTAQQVGRNSPRRTFLVTSIGTGLEFYDFILYGIAAAVVANKVFFTSNDPLTASLLSFAIFGVGFIARPVGGILSGHLADRFGRRDVLIVTLVIMGASTFLIGVLPSYTMAGVWSPILLVTLRIIQGAAAGAEYGGAAAFSIESAPVGKRGFFGSFVSIGMSAGTLLAIVLFAVISAVTTNEQLIAWGWRIPFLFGGVLVLFGVIVRKGMAETDAFEEEVEKTKQARIPLFEAIRKQPATMVKTLIASTGYASGVYIAFTYVLSLVISQGYPTGVTLWAQFCFQVVQVPLVLLFGRLSDRIGRKPVLIVGAVGSAIFGFAFMAMIGTGSVPLLYLGFAITGIFISFMLGTFPSTLAEQFGTKYRASGLSTTYQIGNAIGGGIAPFLAVLVFAWSGNALWSVAALSAIAYAMVAGAVLTMRETARVQTSELGQ